jgi:hypothetical protein
MDEKLETIQKEAQDVPTPCEAKDCLAIRERVFSISMDGKLETINRDQEIYSDHFSVL